MYSHKATPAMGEERFRSSLLKTVETKIDPKQKIAFLNHKRNRN